MTVPRSATLPRAPEEVTLVEGLRRRDASAYDRLLSEHGGRMLRTAQRYLPVLQDAEDAVQDALVSLVRSIERFQGQALLSTWIHRVVVNAALMRIRSRSRRPEASLDALDDPASLLPSQRTRRAWSATADEIVERDDLRRCVLAALAELPEAYRVPLRLRDIDGLDMESICDGLGIAPSTLKARLSRARELLRERLEPTFGAA